MASENTDQEKTFCLQNYTPQIALENRDENDTIFLQNFQPQITSNLSIIINKARQIISV
jgi:hypothetical protein